MRTDGVPEGSTALPDVTHDAVVVIPGIMGSELVDADGAVLWGLSSVAWLVRAWTRRGGMTPLALTGTELSALRAGRYPRVDAGQRSRLDVRGQVRPYQPGGPRVQATRLLRMPVPAPLLGGFEPYTDLVGGLRRVVAHPDAVLEFPYDWRLPVAHNSALLADAIRAHLTRWRDHPAQDAARRGAGTDRPAQVILVAHSMGGLVAHGLSLIPGAGDDVRLTVTLGTPFYGSVKAAVLLGSGEGAPLPHRRLRRVAATLPGVYDLLPTHRALVTENPARGQQRSAGMDDVVRLEAEDVAAVVGADADGPGGVALDLAKAAFDDAERRQAVGLPGMHRPLVGTDQATLASLRIVAGTPVAGPESYIWEGDELIRDEYGRPLHRTYRGDGTVPRYSAVPIGVRAPGVAQQHGALAKSPEAVTYTCNEVTDRGDLGIKLGVGDLGLTVPDLVSPGQAFEIIVTGADDPAAVTCRVERLDDDGSAHPVDHPLLGRQRGRPGLVVDTLPATPGTYRVSVKTGGSDPVTQLVLCLPPDGNDQAGGVGP